MCSLNTITQTTILKNGYAEIMFNTKTNAALPLTVIPDTRAWIWYSRHFFVTPRMSSPLQIKRTTANWYKMLTKISTKFILFLVLRQAGIP